MNNAIIIKTELGNMRIKASIDGRESQEQNIPLPKRISSETELHFHTSCELFFAISGKLAIKDAEGVHTYTDTVVAVSPFTEHAAIEDPERFRILFEVEPIRSSSGHKVYERMSAMLSGGLSPLKCNEKTKFVINEIKKTIKKTGTLVRDELSSLMKLLFISLYEENFADEGGGRIGMENYLIVIDECINSHLSENVNIEFVSKKLHLSYRQTARIIKANYKEPLHRIINQKRLSKAKKLLETTKKPISEIALSVGFSNESYFFRLFSKHYGTTPKKYRSEILKNITD